MHKDRDKSMEGEANQRSQGLHQNAADQRKLPVFIHEEIKILYEVGFEVDPALLDTLLSLPRESLIGDLLAVIQDSKDRYPYIMRQVVNGELDGEETCFLIHAMFLLGELEAEEALDALLDILRQEDEFIELYIGDVFSDGLWPIFFQTGRQQLAKLKEFMRLPGVDTFCKATILDAVEQIGYHEPERRPEVVKLFADLLAFFNSCTDEDEALDREVIAYLIWSIINMGAKELLPATEPLFRKGWVEEGICGSYSDVKEAVEAPLLVNYRQEILPIKEKYAVILSDLTDNFPDFGEMDLRDGFSGPYPPMQVVRDSVKKVGRNDPCPCGSGKKYKKCCGGGE